MAAPRPSPSPSLHDSWERMLPGPPSRSNFGSANLSAAGLLAFAAGSFVAVVDSRSMQLVASVPMPPPASSSLSPFVTAVKWTPLPLRRDLLSTEPSSSHLLLAAGDHQGRIAVVDLKTRSPLLWFESDPARHGVQDLCWLQSNHDTCLLAAIAGPSSLSLYRLLNLLLN